MAVTEQILSTTGEKLNLPAETDIYDINVYNQNLGKIAKALNNLQLAVSSGGGNNTNNNNNNNSTLSEAEKKKIIEEVIVAAKASVSGLVNMSSVDTSAFTVNDGTYGKYQTEAAKKSGVYKAGELAFLHLDGSFTVKDKITITTTDDKGNKTTKTLTEVSAKTPIKIGSLKESYKSRNDEVALAAARTATGSIAEVMSAWISKNKDIYVRFDNPLNLKKTYNFVITGTYLL